MSNLSLGMALARFLQPLLGPPSSLSVGLIAHYTMDDISGSTLVDETGGNDATLVGTTIQPGVEGDAVVLNGSSDRIDTPFSLPTSGDFTVSVFVYLPSLPSEEENILAQYIAGDSSRYLVRLSPPGKVGKADIFIGGSASPGVSLSTGWNFLLIKRAGDTHSIAVNNGPPATLSRSGAICNNTLTLGSLYISPEWRSHLNGRYDLFRAYSRAVTAQEEALLYKKSLLIDLTQHLTMDALDDTTLLDETGGYDGTLVGTPTQVDGVIGQALRIEMGDSIQHSLPSLSTWTVAGWVNLVSATEYNHLLTFSSDQGQGALKIGDDSFNNNLYFYNQSTGSKTTNFQVPKGVWSFFLAKFDGSTLTIRLNDSRQTFSGTAWTLPSGTYICGTYTGGSSAERSDIIVDQRRVYGRAVSQAEEDMMHQEAARATSVSGSDIVAFYPMDNAYVSGSTLLDIEGGHDGTLNGAVKGDGKSGEGIAFPSTTDTARVDIPVSSPTIMAASLFVRSDSSELAWRGAFNLYGGNNDNRSILLASDSNDRRWGIYHQGNSVNADLDWVVGVWYHVYIEYDGEYTRLFIDNVENGTPYPGNLLSSFAISHIYLGNYNYDGSLENTMMGTIDALRFFSKIRTAQQREALANEFS